MAASTEGKPKILFGITAAPVGFLEEALEIVEKLNHDAQVRVVLTSGAARLIQNKIPEAIKHYTDEDEVQSYTQKGDQGLHTELRNWADMLVVYPLSAQSLAEISHGFCENLLNSVVRGWEAKRMSLLWPILSSSMLANSQTQKQATSLIDVGLKFAPARDFGTQIPAHEIVAKIMLPLEKKFKKPAPPKAAEPVHVEPKPKVEPKPYVESKPHVEPKPHVEVKPHVEEHKPVETKPHREEHHPPVQKEEPKVEENHVESKAPETQVEEPKPTQSTESAPVEEPKKIEEKTSEQSNSVTETPSTESTSETKSTKVPEKKAVSSLASKWESGEVQKTTTTTTPTRSTPTIGTVKKFPPPSAAPAPTPAAPATSAPGNSGGISLADRRKSFLAQATTTNNNSSNNNNISSSSSENRRASIPVNSALKIDDKDGILKTKDSVFTPTAEGGWILLGYSTTDSNLLILQASGKGGIEEFKDNLKDDQVQFCLLRVKGHHTLNKEGKLTSRDVFLNWQGKEIKPVEKARRQFHIGSIQALMTPFHAALTVVNKENLTEDNVREKSNPASSSHVID